MSGGTELVEDAMARAQNVVDRPLATVIASDDADARHFLLEALFAGAAIFLLEQYAEGFLEGVGFKDAARGHGQRAQRFLQRLRRRDGVDEAVEAEKQVVDDLLREVRAREADDEVKAAARRLVEEVLLDAGSGRREAADVAVEIERAVLGT